MCRSGLSEGFASRHQLIYSVAMNATPEALTSAIVTIDLAALQSNWKALAAASGVEAGAAIKGEAYGLGMEPVAKALWQAGCRSFFVARPFEGAELRAILPEALIFVLDGLYGGQADYYLSHALIPALISLDEAKDWAAHGMGKPCALHVDTGINRLGLSGQDFAACVAMKDKLNIALVMSHLACSDEPGHPLNAKQCDVFATYRAMLPDVPASFANSSGIYLGDGYLYDLVRPGVALYGGNPLPGKANPMKAVVTLQLKIMQTKFVKKGDTIGYSATWAAPRDSRIALLGAGYRDGIPRKLSWSADKPAAQVFVAGRRVDIVGRVSMDMMAIDVTDLSEAQTTRGTLVEIFGPNLPVEEAASWAGTISYELLTHLGNRYHRRYIGGES
jgi:alanine racemase